MAVTEKQLNELEEFFKKVSRVGAVQLDEGSKVENVSIFVDSHLKVLRHNGDKPMYDVFYQRLLKLREKLS